MSERKWFYNAACDWYDGPPVIEIRDGEQSEDMQDRVDTFRGTVVLSPFQLEGPCAIRVRAETDKGELRALGLVVEQGPVKST